MRRNMAVAVIIFVLALLASSVAWAGGSHQGHWGGHGSAHGSAHYGHHHHHTHGSVGIVVGAPLFGYPYYGSYYGAPPYYAYPPVVAYSSPPVYIERGDEQGQIQGQGQIQPAPAYWYFCSEPRGYYPYISQCPKGWQQVPAQPPANP